MSQADFHPRVFRLALCLAAVFAAAGPGWQVLAYFPVPEDVNADQFKDIADDLRCPTCTGLSVLNSDEKFATQIKEIVVEEMRKGKDKEEIMGYFLKSYGPWILREPPKRGFHALAWLLPGLCLLAGPPLIWFMVWRRRRTYDTLGVRSEEKIVEEMIGRIDAARSLRVDGGEVNP